MHAREGTNEKVEGLQQSTLEDVTGFIQDLVGTLTVYVDQQFIAPRALPIWLAGFRRLEEYDQLTPENQGPRRLAYLWLPDALIEAMIEAQSHRINADEAL